MAVLGRTYALFELLFEVIGVQAVDIIQVIGVSVAPAGFKTHDEGPFVSLGVRDVFHTKTQGYSGLQMAVDARAIFGIQVAQVDAGFVKAVGVEIEQSQACECVWSEFLVSRVGAKTVKIEFDHGGILHHIGLEIQVAVGVMRAAVVQQHLALAIVITADA